MATGYDAEQVAADHAEALDRAAEAIANASCLLFTCTCEGNPIETAQRQPFCHPPRALSTHPGPSLVPLARRSGPLCRLGSARFSRCKRILARLSGLQGGRRILIPIVLLFHRLCFSSPVLWFPLSPMFARAGQGLYRGEQWSPVDAGLRTDSGLHAAPPRAVHGCHTPRRIPYHSRRLCRMPASSMTMCVCVFFLGGVTRLCMCVCARGRQWVSVGTVHRCACGAHCADRFRALLSIDSRPRRRYLVVTLCSRPTWTDTFK